MDYMSAVWNVNWKNSHFLKNDFIYKTPLCVCIFTLAFMRQPLSFFFFIIKSLLYVFSCNFFFITVIKVLLHLKSDWNLYPCEEEFIKVSFSGCHWSGLIQDRDLWRLEQSGTGGGTNWWGNKQRDKYG